MYKSRNKILSKFVERLLRYRKLFKGSLTSLGLDYRGASLMTLYFVVLEISIKKSDKSNNFIT